MALQPSVTPYLRSISILKQNSRLYGAASAAKAHSSDSSSKSSEKNEYLHPREPLKTGSVGNVTVSSIETNKALSRLAVFFRAGSRHESDESPGVAHALRIYAGLGTKGVTAYGLSRTIDFRGGKLTCTAGREHIGYILEASRNQIKLLEDFLKEASVCQDFKPWEMSDSVARMKLERTTRPPEVRTLELLHKAAFRRGLGNSLYTPKFMMGKHTPKMMKEFLVKNFNSATVVGIGLPHEQVLEFGGKLRLTDVKDNAVSPPTKYYPGSEIRKETGGDFAYVALTLEGRGLNKVEEMLACALLHRALGSGPRVKYGISSGALNGATKATPLESVASGFSASYTDSGLVGAFITASPCCISIATKKAAEILQNVSISEEDLKRAKGTLKADLAQGVETDEGCLEEIALQTLEYKKVTPVEELSKLIDSISLASVKKLGGSKLSMAAYGNISKVPYLDELK